jgi:hypothetical protein
LIEKRRKEFKDSKKKEKEGKKGKKEGSKDSKKEPKKGKWAPPTDSEKNRRVIDGKQMFYLHKTKRWVDDRNALPPAANPAVQPPVESNKTNSLDSKVKELAKSNVTHQINVAMQSIANALMEI